MNIEILGIKVLNKIMQDIKKIHYFRECGWMVIEWLVIFEINLAIIGFIGRLISRNLMLMPDSSVHWLFLATAIITFGLQYFGIPEFKKAFTQDPKYRRYYLITVILLFLLLWNHLEYQLSL